MKKPESNPHYSFSALTSFLQCPMSFYLHNIEGVPSDGNAFSDYGSYCHKLLEDWEKGTIPLFALADEYEEGYQSNVTHAFPAFPKGMPEKFFLAGLEYFENFSGFDEDYEILEVEKKFSIQIRGHEIHGIADVICRNKKTGKIEVIDHKSKSKASMKKEYQIYKKQLYLYAIYIKQEYGEWPARLRFNMFREGYWITEDFDEAYVKETEDWIEDTIKKIEATKDWAICPNWFFCMQLCDVIGSCPARDAIVTGAAFEKKEKKGRKKKEKEEDGDA